MDIGLSGISKVAEDHPDWWVVAVIDESENYEVDITEIWQSPAGYELVTATGCSCWDGEYSADTFATLAELVDALLGGGQKYLPSTAGTADLLSQLVGGEAHD